MAEGDPVARVTRRKLRLARLLITLGRSWPGASMINRRQVISRLLGSICRASCCAVAARQGQDLAAVPGQISAFGRRVGNQAGEIVSDPSFSGAGTGRSGWIPFFSFFFARANNSLARSLVCVS